jgi:hypothetical protein
MFFKNDIYILPHMKVTEPQIKKFT